LANPALGPPWLEEATAAFEERINPASLPWNHEAAYQRGSFASLLAISIDPFSSTARITAVGDSVALLLDGDSVVDSFPYHSAREFEQRPFLISTRRDQNRDLLTETGFQSRTRHWSWRGLRKAVILAATDALGRWLIEHRASPQWSLRRVSRLYSRD